MHIKGMAELSGHISGEMKKNIPQITLKTASPKNGNSPVRFPEESQEAGEELDVLSSKKRNYSL